MESDTYKTIRIPSNGIYKEKGSRFLSAAFPVTSQEEIRSLLEGKRKEYWDARHHCYAYMLGNDRLTWRTNDDGEPSGTGGRPILGQINSYGLTNILIVVSRYFGGILLGASGLASAYKSAAADALLNAEIIERHINEYYSLKFGYAAINDVMRIIKEEDINQSEHHFENECSMLINFRQSASERVLKRLARIEGLSLRYLGTR